MDLLSSKDGDSWLAWFWRGILTLGLFVLLTRIVDLQIIRGNYFRNLSDENRIRRIPIIAPRGEIIARGGETLIGDKESKKAVIYDKIDGFKKINYAADSENLAVINEWERDYKLGSLFAHAGGYVGEVNEDEKGKVSGGCPEKGPRLATNTIGRSGLEKEYNCLLSGIDGEMLIEVDALGKKIRVLGKKDPIPGSDLRTTIDYKLQMLLPQFMGQEKGSVIITNEKGEVLAIYSSPSYDPNILVSGSDRTKISEILNDPSLPLFDRSISGSFHPGSVFKPIVAIAALEEGIINKDYVYEDTGQISFKTLYGDFSYKNWYFLQYGGREGKITLTKAITRSTDTFFYKIAELTGIDDIHKWAEIFGLNKKTGIDLPGEIEGLIPDPNWKMGTKGERWFLGDTYNMSIGQGDLAVTPIEMNSAISAIALNGKYCRPHLKEDKESCFEINLNKENVQLVKDGMQGVCSEGGTAYPFFDFKKKYGRDVFCKTGTAQNFGNNISNAWFTMFTTFPDNNETNSQPEIIITVLAENGGEGSKVAAPIARKIVDYWFIGKEIINK
jgi:penicillin-binding protein 2